MLESPRETEREIRDDVGLYIQIPRITDFRGIDRSRDAAVAVGRRRLRGDDLLARRIESGCARTRNAVIERLGSIRAGGVRSLIPKELQIVFVAPFEPRRQGYRTG